MTMWDGIKFWVARYLAKALIFLAIMCVLGLLFGLLVFIAEVKAWWSKRLNRRPRVGDHAISRMFPGCNGRVVSVRREFWSGCQRWVISVTHDHRKFNWWPGYSEISIISPDGRHRGE